MTPEQEAAYWRGKYEGLSQGVEAMLLLGGALNVEQVAGIDPYVQTEPVEPIFDRDEEPEDDWPFLGTPPDAGGV